MGPTRSILGAAIWAGFAPIVMGCKSPETTVVIDNDYSPSPTNPLVVFQAFWQAVAFTTPIPPGASSEPEATVPASPNTAYALLAAGSQPAVDSGLSKPASFVVLSSRRGFDVQLDETLHIPVDDVTFAGNCAARSFLTQEEADFITQRVFQSEFSGVRYDAKTCTTLASPR